VGFQPTIPRIDNPGFRFGEDSCDSWVVEDRVSNLEFHAVEAGLDTEFAEGFDEVAMPGPALMAVVGRDYAGVGSKSAEFA